MIPTPQRVRANRRWSAAAAAVVAASLAAGGWWLLGRTLPALGAAVALAAAAGWATFRFGTRIWRRRLAVFARPFPPAWEDILNQRVAYYSALTDDERERFRQLVAVFLDETPITAAGCEVDEACRVLVAASAVIPIFGFPAWEYGMLREVVVRGGEFSLPGVIDGMGMLGMVGTRGGAFNGTLVLSKADLERGFRRGDKHNVGIHEFAHLIDKADGDVDGVPASLPRECFRPWLRLVREEMERAGDGWSDIPEYGFTNEQEFFAVAAEYFFGAPDELADKHPQLYAMLQRIFRQNPRRRLRGLARSAAGPFRRRARRSGQ